MTTWSTQDLRFDGTSLKSFAFGFEVQGGLDFMPGARGDSYVASRRRGTIWRPRPKQYVLKTMTVWIDARRADGTLPTTTQQKSAFINDNIRALFRLFATENVQVVCERDIILTTSTSPDVYQTVTWTTLVEFPNEISVKYDENFDDFARMDVDVLFHDPCWYEETPRVETLTLDTPVTINHPGELSARDMVFEFEGPLTTINVENQTHGIEFTLSLSMGIDVTSVFDTGKMTLVTTYTTPPSVQNTIGALSNAGSTYPMILYPGDNVLVLTASAGTGSATLDVEGPEAVMTRSA